MEKIKNRNKEKAMAEKFIDAMIESGLDYDDMIRVIKLAKQRFHEMKNNIPIQVPGKAVMVLPKKRFSKSGKYRLAQENSAFVFPKLCPYCNGDLKYSINSMIMDDNGLWMAEDIESDCSNCPEWDDPKFHQWIEAHSQMPYVIQLPVDMAVQKWINERFRFIDR